MSKILNGAVSAEEKVSEDRKEQRLRLGEAVMERMGREISLLSLSHEELKDAPYRDKGEEKKVLANERANKRKLRNKKD